LIISPPRPNNLFRLPAEALAKREIRKPPCHSCDGLDSAVFQPLRALGVYSRINRNFKSMRLRADIWIAAYLRRCEAEGAYSVLRRRGAPEAGAIFVKVDRLDGFAALFGPAPQSELKDGYDRLFVRLHREPWITPAEVEARLAREIGFDPDLWIVETEDRLGRCFLDVAE